LSNQFSRHGILFVISAPSGAGKTTLVEALRHTTNLFYSISCTTRAPRSGEIDGEHYQFLSDGDFRRRIEAGDFLEHAQVQRRLRKRGSETEEQINRRLDTALQEMELWRDYRYTIVSGSIEEDLQRFRHIMAAESYLSRRLCPP
jgi:guanylate kinase